MKEASENQESNGFMSDYFSPGSKERHFNPPHPGPGFPPETPMKPSQIPNRYPPHLPVPRRPLPFHSPPCHYQPPQHTPQPPRNHCHLYQQCNGSAGNGENYHNTRSLRLPNPHGNSYHKDATGQVTHSRYERDRPERAPDERTDHTGQDANKGNTVESRLVPMPSTRLSSPLMSGRETVPLRRSNSWSPSSKLEQASVKDQGRRATFPPNNSSTFTQTQPDQLTLSNQTSHTEDSPHVPLKRRRESSSEDENAKKQCLRPTGPDGNLQCTDANVLSSFSSSQKGLEPSPKTPENHAQTELAHLNCSPSLSLKSCLKRPARGAKQACIKSMHNNLVVLLSPKKTEEKTCEPKHLPAPKRVSFNLPNLPGDSKSPSRVHQADDNKTTDSVSHNPDVKQHKYPSRCRKLQRNKKPVIADDITELFTPDPTTYIVNQGHKTLKVMPECKPKAVKNKNSLSPSVSSNPQTPGPKLCLKDETASTAPQTSSVIVNVPEHIKISLPRIILTPIQLPTKNTRNVDEQESVEKDVVSPGSSPPVSPSRTDGQSEEKDQEDYLDLDLDLNFDLDLEVRSTRSSDSEDVQLVSLREIMTKKEKTEKNTPERTPSESSSPGHRQHSSQHHTATSTKIGNYKNSLDQLLKEFNESKRAKEIEAELLSSCQEDLLKIAEYEETESREEPISLEQQQFLQRFSLTSSIIRDVPPGHEVFNLEKFGRIFNQDTLQLRQCNVTPQSTAQKTILWSSHSQFKLYITSGLFQEAFCSSCSPCPFQITLILFKMMSVRSDRQMSDMILQVLIDIAKTTAVQRVNSGDEKFRVWVPSLADITLVLMNMGAPFVLLFPLETLQPPFTEGELLEDVYVISESPSKQVPRSFPEHNCTNIYKYLSFCLGLCPRFYSDSELLLLLTLLCTVSLETRLLLHTRVELYPVLYDLLKNIRHWDDMMPKICQALTDLTDDHHNMCHLIQQLPHHSRGRKLRQHLSLSMISKLLNGSSLYTPKSNELQLCELRPYLPRMKPSCLLQIVAASSQRSHADGEDDQTILDQQAYYLCYSLLTLVNEATNFYCFPAHQKEQLLLLCSELERHVKCHIREGENWLYRSKVKDLVARIYTKWQMMLQKTRPLNGKLYDYWQPLQSEAGSSQDIEEIDSSQDVTEKEDRDDNEEPVIEMEVTQSENEEKARAVEDFSPSNASQREEMDFVDGALHKLDTEDVEEGCVEEERANSTFKPDSEGDTNTAQDSLCEDMETVPQ